MMAPMYPVRLDGPRVILRDFEAADLDDSMAIVGDPEVTVFLSFDTRTREEQAKRLAADIERAQTNPRPDYYLAIVARDTGRLVGFTRIGLTQPTGGEEQRSGEVGFALRKDRWRQGYTTEATTVMLDFAFDTLGLHRVQAACGPANVGSQATLTKLGFTYETRIRDHVFTNGAWRDSLLYAIFNHVWRSRPRNDR
jgi:ribosomal-protein-alanine N-acetyltransferase